MSLALCHGTINGYFILLSCYFWPAFFAWRIFVQHSGMNLTQDLVRYLRFAVCDSSAFLPTNNYIRMYIDIHTDR